MSVSSLPDKLFFRIGEVASIVGVRPHVLRYWEEEFQVLKPMKTRGSHRVYRRRDVELAVLIRKLLHEEGYTVPGARKRIHELVRDRQDDTSEPTRQSATIETNLRADLLAIREQLQHLINHLDEAEAERVRVFTTAQRPTPKTAGAVPSRTGVNRGAHRGQA